MKKKILFVLPSLDAGGGQKSLVNLLTQIDSQNFQVDLYLIKSEGLFFNSLPKDVRVIEPTGSYLTFSKGFFPSIFSFIKTKDLKMIYFRIMLAIQNRLYRNKNKAEQRGWKYLNHFFEPLPQRYDVAIGYLEKSSIYFTVDKVNAEIKIGWIHTNYSDSGMDSEVDFRYFNKLNHIVTVSEECAHSLRKEFPPYKEKIFTIENIVSKKMILSLAKQNSDLKIFDNQNINILTIARLSHEKGIDLAIKSCSELVKKMSNIKWFIIGEGPEKEKLKKLIKKLNLEKNFLLLGLKENPYPYLNKADIYVQPSRYEGKSLAIDEAKILHRPIVITNFETAKDQIKNNENGLVVAMNENGLTEGIMSIITNKNLKIKLESGLSKEKHSNEEEVEKLYSLINS
ncbi:glycosyltransferase [Sutcliffiella horikoshii]|uniref:Glycosyltransferase n=1 Tax=Sutcliffiella horikoshii TaxID=79883 RepID=A0AA95B6T8_9BACI|nr:glycosyltransferase [Sutcliffiella horikoshii]TYS60078.1 glycosyltransferase [Sutcliffiella horikoshii]